MIKQQFFCDGKNILSIYHNNFEDYSIDKEPKYASETIQNVKLTFQEEFVDKLDINYDDFDNQLSGFLEQEHIKNPYLNLCCNYQELIKYEKAIFKNNEIINFDLFEQTASFIKEWSGFNLKSNPYSISNTFVFTPTAIEVKMHLDKDHTKDILVELLHKDHTKLKIFAKFKLNNVIVDSKIYYKDFNRIGTKNEWNSIDYEIFDEDKLIYAAYNSYFTKTLTFNMGIISDSINTNYKTTKEVKDARIEQIAYSSHKVTIEKENELQDYINKENLIRTQNTEDKLFIFLDRDKYAEALDAFRKLSKELQKGEMWIFDPYFIDLNTRGGKDKLSDIVKALLGNLAIKKNIIFECKSKKGEDIDLKSLKDSCSNNLIDFIDSLIEIKNILSKRNLSLNIEMFGIKEHFHDRYIFLDDGSNLKGYMLGTSFNSFGDNYSSIIELDYKNSKTVFNVFMRDLFISDNILVTKII